VEGTTRLYCRPHSYPNLLTMDLQLPSIPSPEKPARKLSVYYEVRLSNGQFEMFVSWPVSCQMEAACQATT
jgi:hypothetical protein